MIGIYGGTFDPVHFGHLRPPLDVLQVLQLEEIRFVPCGIPPHRQLPLASAQHRASMLKTAISDQAKFVIDDREINRDGKSYMIDTLNGLHQDFATKELCLIVGIDAFNDFDSWKEWQAIVETTKLVVAHRPNYPLHSQDWRPPLRDYVKHHQHTDITEFRHAASPAVFFCPVTQLEISSTRIRELLSAGQDASYLLPASVIEYIRQHKLYC